jgi:sigma-54 dependent transcriptional regulator, acetoin dehydrogenase operon transcriptional activator AcoR
MEPRMASVHLIPFGADAQRAVERQWLAAVTDSAASGEVRAVVRSSWARSLGAAVPPDLREAPVVMDEGALVNTIETTDWLDLARTSVVEHDPSISGAGHILTLFDHEARMLTAEGDPAALEGLADINFRPGALWSEQAVGTNGPGTALATGTATQIIGAEHYCARWQPWHCAAVPLRELSSGRILGVLDISGFREQAHPHTLNLALALALAIEHSLAAREIERRYLVVTRLTHLSHRYPADAAVAVDRHGRILLASPSAPAELAPERDHPALRSLVPDLIGRTRDSLPREVEVVVSADDTRRGVWHPVFDGRAVVGGCLLLEHREVPQGPRAARSAARLGSPPHTFADLVGESPAWRAARDTALAVARTDLPVLLLGEPGTGKEVLAQAIHQASSRHDRPFLTVNCAALSREQDDRTLLGSVSAIGRVEAATEGTLFLDEIAELPAGAQTALLRVVEDGEITRVGEPESRPVNVRVIGATSRDLATLVERRQLRSELYHRINVLSIELPPLRARGEDLPLLARRLFQTVARDLGRPEVVVEGEVFAAFLAYSWPGNLRELKNVVRRLMVIGGETISVADLPQAIRVAYMGIPPQRLSAGEATALAPRSRASHIDQEDARLMDAVNHSRTMAAAAAELGIARSTLYRRMERFGLKPKRVLDRG